LVASPDGVPTVAGKMPDIRGRAHRPHEIPVQKQARQPGFERNQPVAFAVRLGAVSADERSRQLSLGLAA